MSEIVCSTCGRPAERRVTLAGTAHYPSCDCGVVGLDPHAGDRPAPDLVDLVELEGDQLEGDDDGTELEGAELEGDQSDALEGDQQPYSKPKLTDYGDGGPEG